MIRFEADRGSGLRESDRSLSLGISTTVVTASPSGTSLRVLAGKDLDPCRSSLNAAASGHGRRSLYCFRSSARTTVTTAWNGANARGQTMPNSSWYSSTAAAMIRSRPIP